MRRFLTFLFALLLAAGIGVPAPAARADDGLDVYTAPGIHFVGGRHWKTTCEEYSSTVERCRTEIWGDRFLKVNGRWTFEQGWVFNNLTYLPSPAANWAGNPLATPGEHVVDGRRWKTECNTEWTGQGGCRSMIWATVMERSGTRITSTTGWVFNNIVMFATSSRPAVAPSDRDTVGLVLDHEVIGRSREGRPIEAWLIGDPDAQVTQMILGQMHGEERFNQRTAWEILKHQRALEGIKLWVIPTMNPDGEAVGRRQNAAGVDLNGNFGVNWQPESGRHHTGTGPFSEPESRAMRDFVARVEPKELVSMHTPEYAVDSYELKSQSLHDRLIEHLQLPSRYLNCRHGECRGTLTQWVNQNHPTAAITIEYGYAPTPQYYLVTARDGLIAALGGEWS